MKYLVAVSAMVGLATCAVLKIENYTPFLRNSVQPPTPNIDELDEVTTNRKYDEISEQLLQSALFDRYIIRSTDEQDILLVTKNQPTLWETFTTKEKYQMATGSFIIVFAMFLALYQINDSST